MAARLFERNMTSRAVGVSRGSAAWVAAVALACAADAVAQVYRWTDDKGKVHYGDKPPEEAKARALDTSKMDSSTTGGIAGDVRVLPTEIEWFPIRGVTRSEMRLAMQQNGPYNEIVSRKVWGQCGWRIRWKFDHAREAGSCAVKGVALEVSARMWLPKWEDEARATPELRAQWQDFARRLRIHEDGHKNNGVAAAQAVARAVRGLRAHPDCESLDHEIRRVGERVIGEYRNLDRAFDRVESLYATGF
jgi:predicted secreted Zn-dependent protease